MALPAGEFPSGKCNIQMAEAIWETFQVGLEE